MHGVDTYRTKNPAFAKTLAKFLYLPRAKFSCGGVCHGTMTQWYNAHHRGFCVTVEFGADPSWRYLNVVAPNGLLRAVAGSYLSYYRPGFHPWQEDDRALIAAMQAEYAA